jgi:cytochrome b subunit of formate dehydrogenase
MSRRFAAPSFLVGLALLCLPVFAGAQVSSADCAECHGAHDPEIPAVTDSLVAHSAHSGLECLDCHATITEIPHDDVLPKVSCGTCHEEEAETYAAHGRGIVGVTSDLPTCADCHGTHQILPSSDRYSAVHPQNLPKTCGRCHENLDLAKEHDIRLKKPIEVYETSVHGIAVQRGIEVAATCADCHSTGGTAHRILGPGDPESSINHFNIPKTCGKCHPTIEADYWEGIHGRLTARGETDTPVCTQCHGEHGILPVDDPRARVSPAQVAQATCTPCHESAFLNEKYGLPAGRLASFIDSYHGLKSRAGDTEVANCASCHGGHRILPSSDPRSSINIANLRETCGHCHPGITESLAQTKIHATDTGRKTGWSHFFAVLYTVAIIIIIGLMAIYCFIDFRKHLHDHQRQPQVKRMNGNAVWQHSLLLVSFTVLVLTGFGLRYSEFWLFHLLFGWDGGFAVRGIVHRAAAGLFIFSCIWHIFFLRTKLGAEFIMGMVPQRKDFVQFWQMLRFNLDKSTKRPRFGRFSYLEKAEYWALVWGSVVMIVTGLFIWFDNLASHFVPKGVLDVMLVIHFYEAVLATLAILVWHLYGTVFSPAVYPGNPAWVTGTMPKVLYEHEHPEDTQLVDSATVARDGLLVPVGGGGAGIGAKLRPGKET